ncbi:MAG: DUF4344 domain-containing metallopeptidase [Xanthobacteraceae bacterium]
MKWIAYAAGAMLAMASPGLAQSAPQPQPQPPPQQAFPRNPQIAIAYVPPRDTRFQIIHDRMKQLHVLETLQEFLSPLKLPRTLTIKIDQCGGALTLPYRTGEPIVLCYEYLRSVYANAPAEGVVMFGQGRRLTRNQAVVGAIVQLVLHQVARATFDIAQVPVWGRVSEAADNVSGFLMLEFGEDVAWTTLMGSAWYLAQQGIVGAGFFSDTTRPLDAQRFYSFLCIAYGARPKRFNFLVNSFNLPERRARYCRQDYLKLRGAFRKTILPHIDRALLAQVRSRKWLPN